MPNDTNQVPDIFVHDRQTRQTVRVSVASNGTEANNASFRVSLSGNGRYITFDSVANNLANNPFLQATPPALHIFLHDRRTGQSILVDQSRNGIPSNRISAEPIVSADGRFVAYYSLGDNLVSSDTNNAGDVFVFDRLLRRTTRVSVSSRGAQGNGPSIYAYVSANGRYVAFNSSATNLVAGDTNRFPSNPNLPSAAFNDIFVRDRFAQQTTRVTLSSTGAQSNGENGGRFINANGRYVGFWSTATNLVPGDTNGVADIFVRDRLTATTSRISVSTAGVQGNNLSGGRGTQVSMSANSRYVVFRSLATNLVPGDTNRVEDIFLVDRGPNFGR